MSASHLLPVEMPNLVELWLIRARGGESSANWQKIATCYHLKEQHSAILMGASNVLLQGRVSIIGKMNKNLETVLKEILKIIFTSISRVYAVWVNPYQNIDNAIVNLSWMCDNGYFIAVMYNLDASNSIKTLIQSDLIWGNISVIYFHLSTSVTSACCQCVQCIIQCLVQFSKLAWNGSQCINLQGCG